MGKSTDPNDNDYKYNKSSLYPTEDSITNAVINDLVSRSELGVKKYNTTLGQNNHQNMLNHAYEEALDLAQYLKKEITTLNTIQDMCDRVSDDKDLGLLVRTTYGKK